MVRVLGARGSSTGDVDVEAVVMVALLGAFGSRPRGAATVDAAANIVERGLLSGGGPSKFVASAGASVGPFSDAPSQLNGHFVRRARGRPHR